MTSTSTTENPREAEAKPPFPQESLEYPGLESEMTPAAGLRRGVVPGTRPPARESRPHHRRRQRHRPRGGAGLRPGGGRRPHLLPERGLRCRGDGAGRARGRPEGRGCPRRHLRGGALPVARRARGLGAGHARHPGQQRRLPDDPGGHRADPGWRVGAHLQDQHLRHVLPVQGGLAPPAARERDHQHRLHPGLPAVADSSCRTPAPRAPSSPSPRRWLRRGRRRGSGSTWWRPVRSGPRSSPPPCRRRRRSSSGRTRRWVVPRSRRSWHRSSSSWPRTSRATSPVRSSV